MRLTLVSAGAFLGLASLLFLLYVRPFEMMLLGLFAYIVAYIIWSLDIMRSMRRFSAGEKKYAAGVREFRIPGSVAYRVFYPANTQQASKFKGGNWFREGTSSFLTGYVYLAIAIDMESIWGTVLEGLCFTICFFLPPTWFTIPYCYKDAPLAQQADEEKKGFHTFPLVLFSHGLTGTGEEHAMFFTDLARRGVVVAILTHQDGSSSRVRKEDGSLLYYRKPNFKNYSMDFRPNQIKIRQEEMEAMRNHIFQNGSFEGVIDRKKVLGAGFSYGSATASLESIMNPEAYRAVILWDGWFFIDQGEGIPFPKEAHDSGLKHKALFVGSTEFSNYKKLSGYTKSLIKTGLNGTRSLVLPNSKHEHFTDCPFWLPTTLVEALSGKKEGGYLRSYIKLRDEMIAFIESTCG